MINSFSQLDPNDVKVYFRPIVRGFFSSFVCLHLENKGVFLQVFTFQNCFQFLWLRLIMLDVSTFPIIEICDFEMQYITVLTLV